MQVAKKLIRDNLSTHYSKQEIESLGRLILEKITGYSRLGFHLNQHETISAANLTQIKEITDRLVRFEPIQYILGETEFYGAIIKVNPAVLIPRPETEELVDWIVNDYRGSNPSILDIGTGSGCIPVTLVKNLPGASAEGWDISVDALAVAKENAKINNTEVDFHCVDILNLNISSSPKKYDIIVSNPPYVTIAEQQAMLQNVTDYEPHLALFVPDEDALIFYRAISDMARIHLNPGGNLYFEINEQFANQVSHLLADRGFVNITVRKDINEKQRMMKAEWPKGEKENE